MYIWVNDKSCLAYLEREKKINMNGCTFRKFFKYPFQVTSRWNCIFQISLGNQLNFDPFLHRPDRLFTLTYLGVRSSRLSKKTCLLSQCALLYLNPTYSSMAYLRNASKVLYDTSMIALLTRDSRTVVILQQSKRSVVSYQRQFKLLENQSHFQGCAFISTERAKF